MSSSLDYQIWVKHQQNADDAARNRPHTAPPTKDELQGYIYLMFIGFFFMLYYSLFKRYIEEEYIYYVASAAMIPTIYIYFKYKSKIDNVVSFIFGSFVLIGLGSWAYSLIA